MLVASGDRAPLEHSLGVGKLNDIKWGVIFCVGEFVVGEFVCGQIHRNSPDLSLSTEDPSYGIM